MTVAFSDVVIAQELFAGIDDLADLAAVQTAVRKLYSSRKDNHSFVVNVLSMALYELFAANDGMSPFPVISKMSFVTGDSYPRSFFTEHLSALKQACFAYFELGGSCVSGPVGLLSV